MKEKSNKKQVNLAVVNLCLMALVCVSFIQSCCIGLGIGLLSVNFIIMRGVVCAVVVG